MDPRRSGCRRRRTGRHTARRTSQLGVRPRFAGAVVAGLDPDRRGVHRVVGDPAARVVARSRWCSSPPPRRRRWCRRGTGTGWPGGVVVADRGAVVDVGPAVRAGPEAVWWTMTWSVRPAQPPVPYPPAASGAGCHPSTSITGQPVARQTSARSVKERAPNVLAPATLCSVTKVSITVGSHENVRLDVRRSGLHRRQDHGHPPRSRHTCQLSDTGRPRRTIGGTWTTGTCADASRTAER